jgi:hypothetical protein
MYFEEIGWDSAKHRAISLELLHGTHSTVGIFIGWRSTVLQEHAFISVVLHFRSHGDAAVIVETLASG